MSETTINLRDLEAKLASKVLSVSQELSLVNDGKNQHSGYEYISYQNLNIKLPDLLVKHKLAIVPEILECKESEIVGKNGSTGIRSLIYMTFDVIDTETGFKITKKWISADNDNGGKSLGKAITEAMKRFEFKLFHVASNDKDTDETTVDGSFNKPTYEVSKPANGNGKPVDSKKGRTIAEQINDLSKATGVPTTVIDLVCKDIFPDKEYQDLDIEEKKKLFAALIKK